MPAGGKRPGAGRKSGDAWKGRSPRTQEAKQLAQAVVRDVLACDRNPVLRLVEIAYDPDVDVAIQVTAAAAACPFLFPKKSIEMTATVALDAPNATAIVDKLLRQFAALPQNQAIESPVLTAEVVPTEVAA